MRTSWKDEHAWKSKSSVPLILEFSIKKLINGLRTTVGSRWSISLKALELLPSFPFGTMNLMSRSSDKPTDHESNTSFDVSSSLAKAWNTMFLIRAPPWMARRRDGEKWPSFRDDYKEEKLLVSANNFSSSFPQINNQRFVFRFRVAASKTAWLGNTKYTSQEIIRWLSAKKGWCLWRFLFLPPA